MNRHEARHYPEDWSTEQQSVTFRRRVLAWLDDCHQRFDREVERGARAGADLSWIGRICAYVGHSG
jgi:hypothetical protein